MPFSWVLSFITDGGLFRRACWDKNCYIKYKDTLIYFTNDAGEHYSVYSPSQDDMLSRDWRKLK